MAGKDKGRSTIITAEEHNAQRRATKAKRKGNHSRRQQHETLNEGIMRDRLEKYAEEMFGILKETCVSSSPAATKQLERAAFAYVTELTMNSERRMSRRTRHIVALTKALKEVDGQPASLVNYLTRQLDDAFRRVRPPVAVI